MCSPSLNRPVTLGGVRGPPNPSEQGDRSFSLTSTPQFPKNTSMVASPSTPKPPLALKTRKAISYPFISDQQLRLDIRPSILQEYLYGHIPLNPETASRPQNAKSDFLSIV
jgi:hypothetical protein